MGIPTAVPNLTITAQASDTVPFPAMIAASTAGFVILYDFTPALGSGDTLASAALVSSDGTVTQTAVAMALATASFTLTNTLVPGQSAYVSVNIASTTGVKLGRTIYLTGYDLITATGTTPLS